MMHRHALSRETLLASLSHLSSHLDVGILPPLYPLIIREFNLTQLQLGLIASSSRVTSGLFQSIFGVITRYFRRKSLLSLGNLLLGFSFIIIGMASSFPVLIISRLFAGVGMAPHHPVGISLISDSVKKEERGSAMGIFFSIAYIGNLVGPLIVLSMTPLVGWRLTLIFISVAIIIIGLLTLALIKEGSKEFYISRKSMLNISWKEVVYALKSKNVSAIFATKILGVGGFGHGVLITFFPVFLARELSLDIRLVSLFTLGLLASGIVGSFIISKISDLFGRRATCAFASLFLAPMFYYTTITRDIWLMFMCVSIIGFLSYGLIPSLQTFLVDSLNESVRDTIVGISFTLAFLSTALWLTIIGSIIDVYGFNIAFSLLALLLAICGILILGFTSEVHSKEKLHIA